MSTAVTQDEPTSRRQAVRDAVGSAAYAVQEAWRVNRRAFLGTIAMNLLMALVPAGQVVAIGWLTRAASTPGSPVLLPLIALAGTVGVGQVSGGIGGLLSQRIAVAQEVHQQDKLLATICRLTPQELATAEMNAVIQASRGALFDVSHHVFSVIRAVQGVLSSVLVCVAVWRIDLLAGSLVVLALVPLLVAAMWEAKYQDAAFKPVGEERRHVGYAVEQLVFQRTGTELGTLGSGPLMARKAHVHQLRIQSLLFKLFATLSLAQMAAAIGTSVLLAFALFALVHARLGAPGIAAGVVGVIAGMSATQSAGFSVGFLVSDAPNVTRFRRFVASVPQSEPQRIIPQVGELRASGITVTYPGKDEPSLVDGHLTVRRGEMVALVGVNGAGKTTMVNAVLGIVDLDSGQVVIDGVDAATMTPAHRLSHFGLLTQEFGRYELTVREAVLLGAPPADYDDDQVWAALAAARIDDVVRELPDGLDAQLGQQWGGVGLSGGQWQRIALARIHLRGAAIWVLDEPTSAIDAEAEQQIFDELRRSRDQRATIVVSHRAWTLRRMDQIHVFEHGRIVESGTYDELLAAGGRFAEIFAEQAG